MGRYVMIMEDDSNVDWLIKKSANHNLNAMYKIGVYGKERQHELFIKGWFINYLRFKKDINHKIKINKVKGEA